MKKINSITDILLLIQIFEEMADLSTQVIQSVQSGDEALTRRSIDSIRQNYADLNDQIDDFDFNPLIEELDVVFKLRFSKAINKIDTAKPLIKAWCSRFEGIYSEADYLVDAPNINAHIDFMIPATWNWGRDLLVLMGDFPREYFEALSVRGQKRIICIGSCFMPSEFPYHFVKDEDQILPFILLSSRPPPKKMKTFSLANFNGVMDFQKIQKKITDAVNLAWMNFNTTNNFGRKWIDQGISNLNIISRCDNWTSFADGNKKKNAIIVSPGPSLDKNIKELIDIPNDVCLIAPAQSLKILSKYKIYPDLVVVVDPADLVYLFDDVDLSRVGGLLASPSCFGNIFELPFKNIYTFDGNQISDRWILNIFNDEAIGVSGGSVSVDCLLFALKCGFNKIALVGQDLALTGGRQYAENSASGNIKAEINSQTGEVSLSGFSDKEINSLDYFIDNPGITSRSSNFLLVPGYYGGFVETLPDYYQFFLQFKKIARENISDSIALYNCTEGGAFISGFEHVSLKDFISSLPVSTEPPILSSKYSKSTRVNNLLRFLKTNLETIDDLISHCQNAELLLRGIMEDPSNTSLRNDLIMIESQVLSLVENINFISLGIQQELNASIKVIGRSKNITDSIAAELSLIELIKSESIRISAMLAEQQLTVKKKV